MSATDTSTPPPTPAKKPAGTEYVVLEENGGSWYVGSIVRATSAQAAVHLAVAKAENPSIGYVAVPARSWKPVRVQVETISRVRLEDA